MKGILLFSVQLIVGIVVGTMVGTLITWPFNGRIEPQAVKTSLAAATAATLGILLLANPNKREKKDS